MTLAGGSKLTLPSRSELRDALLSQEVLRMSPADAERYRMPISGVGRNATIICGEFGEVRVAQDGKIGVEEIADTFLKMLARQKLKPPPGAASWIQNHYRWIVWTLASLERSFPGKCGGSMLNCHGIIQRLHRRYHREITLGERSHLKKVSEHAEQGSRFAVLCVASVSESLSASQAPGGVGGKKPLKPKASTSAGTAAAGRAATSAPVVLLLTDGWYSIKAVLDEPLQLLLRSGKIAVGLKLCVCGGEYSSPGPMPPLEALECGCLKLSFNGARRAKWNAQLGVQQKWVFPVPMWSLKPGQWWPGGLHQICDPAQARRLLYGATVRWLLRFPGWSRR